MHLSKSEIEDLKARVDLVDVMRSFGVEMKRQGRNYVGRCPFHEKDKTPSLVANPQTQLYSCFGACRGNGKAGIEGKCGGDVLTFLMKLKGWSFQETCDYLRGKPEPAPPRKPLVTPGYFSLRTTSQPALVIRLRAIERHAAELSENRLAQDWLESRGLLTRELWRSFRVGFSTGSLEEMCGTESSEARRLLHEIGYLNEDGKEPMKGRVVFPLVGLNQLPVNVYGRAIREGHEPKHLLQPGKPGLFNPSAGKRGREVLVVESVLCAMACAEVGVLNAVPLLGVGGPSEELLTCLSRLNVTGIVVGLDADEAGRAATPRVMERFAEAGFSVRAVEWPEKDPNAVLMAYGPERMRHILDAVLSPPKARDIPKNGTAFSHAPEPLPAVPVADERVGHEEPVEHHEHDGRVEHESAGAEVEAPPTPEPTPAREAAPTGEPTATVEPTVDAAASVSAASFGAAVGVSHQDEVESIKTPLLTDDGGHEPRRVETEESANLGVETTSEVHEIPSSGTDEASIREGNLRGAEKPERAEARAEVRVALVLPEPEPPERGQKARVEPKPAKATATVEELRDETLTVRYEDRLWHITWLSNPSTSHMRATVHLSLLPEAGAETDVPLLRFVDSLNLLASRSRDAFCRRALSLLSPEARALLPTREALERLVAGDLVSLYDLGEERRRLLAEAPKDLHVLTPERKASGLSYLKAPGLFSRLGDDLDALGYVGERKLKVLGYFVAISRKLPDALSMVILSSSGSGKSALAEVLERLTPEEDLLVVTRFTGNSLYWMGKDALKRKFVSIEERAGSDEADYAIRALQSKRQITQMATVKDQATGKLETKYFTVEGPTSFLESTTESRIHFENATRCFEGRLDESTEQTRRIQKAQRKAKTRLGRMARRKAEEIEALHRDVQRCLRIVKVDIPWADLVEFPSAWTRNRRDHLRFLNLVEVVAFFHQHQRPLTYEDTGEPCERALEDLSDEELPDVAVTATVEDYASAVSLYAEILEETFQELGRPLRELLEVVRALVAERSELDPVITARQVADRTRLPLYTVKRQLLELVEMEYLGIVRVSGLANAYRLLFSEAAKPIAGLLTPDELRRRMPPEQPEHTRATWSCAGQVAEPASHELTRTT